MDVQVGFVIHTFPRVRFRWPEARESALNWLQPAGSISDLDEAKCQLGDILLRRALSQRERKAGRNMGSH